MEYFKEEFSTGYLDGGGHRAISSQQTSLIVAILSVGTVFGALGASAVADFLGRRWGLIFSCAIFNAGVAMQVGSYEQKLLIAGRAVAGFGVGLVSAIVPLYQSETAPKWIRGTIVGAYQWAITFGLFLASCANQGTHERIDSGSYRIPLAIQFAWAIILSIGMYCLPETPRYLIKMKQYDAAKDALSRLRKLPETHTSLRAELDEIQASYEYEISLGKARYVDCFKGNIGKRLVTGCILQGLQQLTGINFIFYYGTYFFKRAGIDNPFVVTLITNIVNIFATIPGLWLVEKAGRRNLLLGGAIGMTIADLIVGIVGVAADGIAVNICLIVFVCVFICFFAASWGPVAWVVTGEIFPLKVRAKALSMTTATNWLLNFALSYCTPYLVDEGPGNAALGSSVFFIWGGFNAVAIVFVYLMIYETKGLSLEEVDELYYMQKCAWRSTKTVLPVPSGLSGSIGTKGEEELYEEKKEGEIPPPVVTTVGPEVDAARPVK